MAKFNGKTVLFSPTVTLNVDSNIDPIEKTPAMDIDVGVDEDGKLYADSTRIVSVENDLSMLKNEEIGYAGKVWTATENGAGWADKDTFVATYDETTWQAINDAVTAGKVVIAVRSAAQYSLDGKYNNNFYFSSMGTGTSAIKTYLRCSQDDSWTKGDTTFETLSNRVGEITGEGSNSKYPTTKAVADYVPGAIFSVLGIYPNVISVDYKSVRPVLIGEVDIADVVNSFARFVILDIQYNNNTVRSIAKIVGSNAESSVKVIPFEYVDESGLHTLTTWDIESTTIEVRSYEYNPV